MIQICYRLYLGSTAVLAYQTLPKIWQKSYKRDVSATNLVEISYDEPNCQMS